MPKFAANLSMLYNEVPFMERFDKAGAAGFKAVEFLYPYAFSIADIKAKLVSNGLAIVLHNIPAGDWDGGERGIACLPDRVDEYRAGVAKAIEYAKALGVPQLNCLAGKAPAGADRKVLHDTFVANLKYTAAEFKKNGLKLLIEPINTYDIPGFFLSTTAQGIAILDEVAANTKDFSYELGGGFTRAPLQVSEEHEIVRLIQNKFQSHTGTPIGFRGEWYWTDAALMNDAGITTVLFGVDGEGAHAAIEWATESSVHIVADVLTAVVVQWCN